MSTYAQVSDVRSVGRQIAIDASSKPSEGEVQTFLEVCEAEVNACLANTGYVVPIPADKTAAVLILRMMVAYGALAMTIGSRGMGLDASLVSQAEYARAYYDTRLKALRSPKDPLQLPGVTTTDSLPLKNLEDAIASSADDAEAFVCGDFDGDVERRRPSVTERF